MNDGGTIYLVRDDGALEPMVLAPYESEALLQELLARHPSLLAGDSTGDALRFVLVRREMGVPDAADAAQRWSIDHLFLDSDGVPTLVEVKRSSDTRIRREVVGQMLDYAANAVVYWPLERLRSQFEQTCADDGVTPEDRLRSRSAPSVARRVFTSRRDDGSCATDG